ncbi:hypothetical protein H6P81_003718 [Aristolochia fimbriata]|uniref:Uncharacterized protein n=1 Tax=Aristolochia fimbriata TaxID=158543 RepID=A0AAV7FDE5_ARIFI|nr:hypothetical protein H6P81_003718 [Aristolochia fimbriata]
MVVQSNYDILCWFLVWLVIVYSKEYPKLKEYPKVHLSCQCVCVMIIACFELEEYPKRILKYLSSRVITQRSIDDHLKVEFLESILNMNLHMLQIGSHRRHVELMEGLFGHIKVKSPLNEEVIFEDGPKRILFGRIISWYGGFLTSSGTIQSADALELHWLDEKKTS